jgi:hypothetical protein
MLNIITVIIIQILFINGRLLYPKHLNVAILFVPGPLRRDPLPHLLRLNNRNREVKVGHNHRLNKAVVLMPFTANKRLVRVLESNVGHLR